MLSSTTMVLGGARPNKCDLRQICNYHTRAILLSRCRYRKGLNIYGKKDTYIFFSGKGKVLMYPEPEACPYTDIAVNVPGLGQPTHVPKPSRYALLLGARTCSLAAWSVTESASLGGARPKKCDLHQICHHHTWALLLSRCGCRRGLSISGKKDTYMVSSGRRKVLRYPGKKNIVSSYTFRDCTGSTGFYLAP